MSSSKALLQKIGIGRSKSRADPKLGSDGLAPTSGGRINGLVDGLGRGDGKPHSVPQTFADAQVNPRPSAYAGHSLKERIKSHVPFTQQHKQRKIAEKEEYKRKSYIKTSAERILEGIEARKALEAEAGKSVARA